jgi:hypothetical protein
MAVSTRSTVTVPTGAGSERLLEQPEIGLGEPDKAGFRLNILQGFIAGDGPRAAD